MKVKIVRQQVSESTMDYLHGHSYPIKRLWIEEKDNLVITPHGDQVYAFTGFKPKGKYQIIGEVDMPDELVEKALAFAHAKKEFDALKSTFETLLA